MQLVLLQQKQAKSGIKAYIDVSRGFKISPVKARLERFDII